MYLSDLYSSTDFMLVHQELGVYFPHCFLIVQLLTKETLMVIEVVIYVE